MLRFEEDPAAGATVVGGVDVAVAAGSSLVLAWYTGVPAYVSPPGRPRPSAGVGSNGTHP